MRCWRGTLKGCTLEVKDEVVTKGCWHTPLIPAFRRPRKKNLWEFEANLGYRESSRIAKAIQRNPVLGEKNRVCVWHVRHATASLQKPEDKFRESGLASHLAEAGSSFSRLPSCIPQLPCCPVSAAHLIVGVLGLHHWISASGFYVDSRDRTWVVKLAKLALSPYPLYFFPFWDWVSLCSPGLP